MLHAGGKVRFLINKDCTLEEATSLIHPYSAVAVDIESVNLEVNYPLGIGVAIDSDTALYFFNHKDEYVHELIDNADVVIIHNAAYDVPMLKRLGFTIKDYDDTMLMCYAAGILDKKLPEASMNVLGRENPSITSLWEKKEQGNIGVSHKEIGRLCMIHACNTYGLWEAVPKTWLYENIDKPCIELVMEMEHWGIEIDQYRLTQVEQHAIDNIAKLEAIIYEELGPLNIASNPQLLKALQAKGIIGTRKVGSAKGATSKEALKAIGLPVTDAIAKWRSERIKTIGTYVKAFRHVDDNGRLHTSFGYTRSGRWSSGGEGKTNLQNITRDTNFEEEDEE